MRAFGWIWKTTKWKLDSSRALIRHMLQFQHDEWFSLWTWSGRSLKRFWNLFTGIQYRNKWGNFLIDCGEFQAKSTSYVYEMESSLRALHVSWHFVDIQIIWRQNGKLNSKPTWNVLRKLVLTHPWHSSQSKPIFVTWKKHFRRKNNNSFPFPFGVLNVLIWEENLLLFVMKTCLQNFVLTKKKCDERWRAM